MATIKVIMLKTAATSNELLKKGKIYQLQAIEAVSLVKTGAAKYVEIVENAVQLLKKGEIYQLQAIEAVSLVETGAAKYVEIVENAVKKQKRRRATKKPQK